jgi:hypothetical protein
MTPRSNFFNVLWVQGKKAYESFLFLSQVPVNELLPGTPAGPLWRELSVYRALFYIFLKIPHKNFPK